LHQTAEKNHPKKNFAKIAVEKYMKSLNNNVVSSDSAISLPPTHKKTQKNGGWM
jgi:hypothetical protein